MSEGVSRDFIKVSLDLLLGHSPLLALLEGCSILLKDTFRELNSRLKTLCIYLSKGNDISKIQLLVNLKRWQLFEFSRQKPLPIEMRTERCS